MLLATFAVAVLPLLVVSAIQATGALGSTLFSVAAAAALSVGASVVGSALWTRRQGSRDVVFADLMIWGWVRRLRTERRLANASELLGNRAKLTPSRQAELLERLSATLEARDPYTHGHSRRVTRYSEAMARRMGLARVEVAKVRTAAAVHDVGKVKTPRDVLNKPGVLSDEEFAAIKLHPVDGAELVAGLGDPELTAMVRHHHERLDGSGYPDGLGGADIPLGARIIAVADTFDAITSTRPYRAGAKHKVALDILRNEAGSQLDPAAVAAFLSYYSGRNSVAWWSLLVAEPPRFLSWVLGWFQGAGATPLAKGVLAAGATALIGGTLASPPAPKAEIRSNSMATAAAQGRAGSGGSAAAVIPAPSPRSRDRADHRTPPRSRRRHRRPDRPLEPSGSRGPGSRSDSDDVRTEAGAGSGPGSSGPRDGGTDGNSSGGGSGGGDSGGGGSGGGSGDGSGTGSHGKLLPSIDAPELPPPPADVPIPAISPPELPNLPEALPEVETPSVDPPSVRLPRLGGK